MNRAQRRKIGMKVTNNMIKNREQSMAKKQWGLGFLFTNLVGMITLGPKIFILYDKRMK